MDTYNKPLNNSNKTKNLWNRSDSFIKNFQKYIYKSLTTASIVLTLWTNTALTWCIEDDPLETTIDKPTTMNEKPTITIYKSEINISTPKILSVTKDTAFLWNEKIASWQDDTTDSCSVSFILINKYIYPGDTISYPGTFSIIVSDEKWETNSADIHLRR